VCFRFLDSIAVVDEAEALENRGVLLRAFEGAVPPLVVGLERE